MLIDYQEVCICCSLKCLVTTDVLRGLAPACRPPEGGMGQVPSHLVTDTKTSSPDTEMQNQSPMQSIGKRKKIIKKDSNKKHECEL